MDLQGSDGFAQAARMCTICSKVTSGLRHSSSRSVSCCSKVKWVHLRCAKNLFKVTNPDEPFNLTKWKVDSNCDLLCSECRVNCFFYHGRSHHLLNDGVRIGRCNYKKIPKWYYYLGGCLKKNLLTLKDKIYSECSTKQAEELKLPRSTSIIMKKRDTSAQNHPRVISKISERK